MNKLVVILVNCLIICASADELHITENIDFESDLISPSNIGDIDIGINTVSGSLNWNTSSNAPSGDYADSIEINVPEGIVVTKMTLEVTGFESSTDLGTNGVMSLDGSVQSLEFSGNTTLFVMDTPTTGPDSFSFQIYGSPLNFGFLGLGLMGDASFSYRVTIYAGLEYPTAYVHYVNINNKTPSFPYTSWETAATNIQDAVDQAVSGDTVLVSNGVYMLSTEIMVTENITIQSSNGPYETIIDGGGAVRCANLTSSQTLITGFTIRNGIASMYQGVTAGAGVFTFNGVISNCVVTANGNGYGRGGGVYGGLIIDSIVSSNSAWAGGGIYTTTAINCIIEGNDASYGGGMDDSRSENYANNCIFIGNTSANYGGAVSSGNLNNCTVVSNTARLYGGGVYNADINNCIVYDNIADTQPDIYQYSDVFYSCSPALTNGLDGNISSIPEFVHGYYLAPTSPCIDAGSNELAVNSTDRDGNQRIQGGGVDMGAYEWMNLPRIASSHAQSIQRRVALSYSPAPVSFDIWNSGSSNLTYTITDNADWLELSSSDGTSTGNGQEISLQFNTGNLPIGNHLAKVSISSSDGSNDPVEFGIEVEVFDPFDHFEIAYIPSPRPVGMEFPVTVYAQDETNGIVRTFTNSIHLSASAEMYETSTNLLQDTSYGSTWTGGERVRGIRFTPSSNLILTHVRRIFGENISIWKDNGTLLASKNVTGSSGVWVEAELDSPVYLTAGQTYRICAYLGASGDYYGTTSGAPISFPHGTINNGCSSDTGDVFPSSKTTTRYLIDFRYIPGIRDSIAVSKTVTEPFVEGVWHGSLLFHENATNVVLTMTYGSDITLDSNMFDLMPIMLDQDTDGLLDYWEASYFGHITNCIPESDIDGDGQDHLEECIANSDPTDPVSNLQIDSSKNSESGYVINWVAIPGRSFDILRYSYIEGAPTEIGTEIPYPYNSYTDTVFNVENCSFYRIRAQLSE